MVRINSPRERKVMTDEVVKTTAYKDVDPANRRWSYCVFLPTNWIVWPSDLQFLLTWFLSRVKKNRAIFKAIYIKQLNSLEGTTRRWDAIRQDCPMERVRWWGAQRRRRQFIRYGFVDLLPMSVVNILKFLISNELSYSNYYCDTIFKCCQKYYLWFI